MGELAELMQLRVQVVAAGPDPSLVLSNMLAEWGGAPYAELSVLLVHLRYLGMLHQTHHWVAKGDVYYGDHLLFERLYNKVVEEADHVAEKAVGLGSEANVNLMLQASQLQKLCTGAGAGQTLPQSSDLAKLSLAAELSFLAVVKAMCLSMQEQGTETPGVENLLQQVADTHEGHVYLLKRRCSAPALGM